MNDEPMPRGIRITGNTIHGAKLGGIHVETPPGVAVNVSDNSVRTGGEAVRVIQVGAATKRRLLIGGAISLVIGLIVAAVTYYLGWT